MPQPLLRQIKASAGSGKTYDLTHRFLEHLGRAASRAYAPSCGLDCGNGWGDILAVTFTNSAAAEMKERVVRRLKEIALGLGDKDAPIPPRQAMVWVDILLRQYSSLNIRTIDSLLHLIVRTAALDLELPPDFQPAFATEETLAPILDACMERAWQGDEHMRHLLREACRSLLFHTELKGFMAGERVARHLQPLLNRALLERHCSTLSLASPKQMEARHDALVRDYIVSARALIKAIDEEKLPLQKRAAETLDKCTQGSLTVLDSAWLAKEELDDCLLKAGKGKASDTASRAFVRLRDAAELLAGKGHLLRKGLELAPFAALAEEVAVGLDAFQRAEGKVPGMLIPELARQVLEDGRGVSDALCRMGTRLSHWLIDEFQDTSLPQWRALRPLVEEALSKGGSLTWVGDMKQAIYGWRGGDASLFDGVLHDAGLRAIAPEPQIDSLPTNWRSREEIVRFNNNFFKQLDDPKQAMTVLAAMLPQDMPPLLLGEAAGDLAHTFAKAAQVVPARKASHGGLVSLTPIHAENSGDMDEAVHARLDALLEELEGRRAWADVAILVRSNTAASQVASWLMERDIPVITENSLLLAEHPLIVQTVAFLSFLDSPQDDLSFWTLATGSLWADICGLDPEALASWVVGRRKGYLSMAFRDAFPQAWERWLAPFHAKAGLMSPYDTVQEFYRHWQVMERFPEVATFLRRFLEVVHAAEERGNATLGAFLEHWKQSGGEEKLPMPENMDAVRIMTIHKSKGLQFPVVILPWMHFSARPDTPPVRVHVDGLEVLAPRCKEMGEVHYRALADAAREALNLLYVAWTRAVDELHVFHTTTPGLLRMRGLANALEVLLPCAGHALPCALGTPPQAAPRPAPCPEPPLSGGLIPHGMEPLPTDDAEEGWRPMQWLPRLKIFRNPLEGFVLTGKRRGLLAHHCLEQLRLTGDAARDAQRAVSQGLRTFPLPVPDTDAVAEELARALSWYAALPQAREWMRRGVPEQSVVDDEGDLHRMDLLIPAASPQDAHVAVEYKTGGAHEAHIRQTRRYLRLLTDLGDAASAHAVLVYLDLQCCRTVTLSACSELLPFPPDPGLLQEQPA